MTRYEMGLKTGRDCRYVVIESDGSWEGELKPAGTFDRGTVSGIADSFGTPELIGIHPGTGELYRGFVDSGVTIYDHRVSLESVKVVHEIAKKWAFARVCAKQCEAGSVGHTSLIDQATSLRELAASLGILPQVMRAADIEAKLFSERAAAHVPA